MTQTLIVRLQYLTAPDREVDIEIYRLACKHQSPLDINRLTRDSEYTPTYTSSIDAALTLVPEGWRVNWAGECADRSWFFECIGRQENLSTDRFWHVVPAIALCIAALKAREVMK